MPQVYYDNDAKLSDISTKTIAVIGYGNQGGAQAQNLKDSGLNVIIGLMESDEFFINKAKKEGFQVYSIAEAAKRGDVIQMLIPDEFQSEVYKKDIEPNLKKGNTLMFSHGFNIHYNQIVPSKDIDVIMVAPKGPGHLVRRTYQEGKGVPCLIAIYQDASSNAKKTALAYASGIGGGRAGVFETTFREETETDLFGEQTVLCGGCTALVQAGFEVLVEAGYEPEMAYFECMHELKLIVDLMYEGGIANMRAAISNTAEYGDVTVGPRLIDAGVKQRMRDALERIQNGEFAREFINECRLNKPVLSALRRRAWEHPIEKVGSQLRAMMSWLKK